MNYLSVCSGIEAATVAWHGLGWKAAGFAEIEKFPSAVLKERFPDVTNYGDMTKFKEWENVGTVDLLVGGTPCQSFAVAGLRKGLADPRGNLMLTFGAIAHHFKARWVVWENVPGVLSSNKGRDFGTFLGMLAECGYGFAYRVLDAQFFGVPQRRRRVFVVGCLGSWLNAAKVLFDSGCLSGNPPPSRKKGEGFASEVAPSLTASGRGVERTGESRGQDPVVACYGMPGNWINKKPENGGNATTPMDNLSPCITGMDRPVVCLMDQGGMFMDVAYNMSGTLRARMVCCAPIVLAFNAQGSASQGASVGEVSPTLDRSKTPAVYSQQNYLCADFAVRRLTPIECERLQGFPDDWTKIPWRNKPAEQCPDGPRYKACGNSMAVPVMRWIGERIEKVNRERK